MTTNALMELLKNKKQEFKVNDRQRPVKIPLNTSRWRILPGWDKNNPQFWHEYGQHFIKDSSGKVKAVYVCVDKTYGRPCNVCAAVETSINHTDDPQMKELLGGARASQRILMNALLLDGPSASATEPVVVEMPKSVFEQIVNIAEEWEGRAVSIAADGVDLMITKTGSGLTTKYSVTPSPKSTKIDPSVMNKVTNLAEYVAQENESAANRALTSIAAVAGLLPAATSASASVARPAIAQRAALSETTIEDAELQEIANATLNSIDEDDAELVKAVEGAAATATVAAPEPTGDSEIDDLMKELSL